MYRVIEFRGVSYVVRNYVRPGVAYDQPNFLGIGVALCGILKDNETIENWIDRLQASRIKSDMNFNPIGARKAKELTI